MIRWHWPSVSSYIALRKQRSRNHQAEHLELKFCAGSNKVIFAEHAINLLSLLDLVVVLQANLYVVVTKGLKVSATRSGMEERVEVFTLMRTMSGGGGKVSFNAMPWILYHITLPCYRKLYMRGGLSCSFL